MKRELRDAVLFTNHNVLRDPPFSRQDLIACRNVLIYLQREDAGKGIRYLSLRAQPGWLSFPGQFGISRAPARAIST